jgi:hypothetical protein
MRTCVDRVLYSLYTFFERNNKNSNTGPGFIRQEGGKLGEKYTEIGKFLTQENPKGNKKKIAKSC